MTERYEKEYPPARQASDMKYILCPECAFKWASHSINVEADAEPIFWDGPRDRFRMRLCNHCRQWYSNREDI